VEITFKLLCEETNNEVKLNDHLKEDMTAVCTQTRMGCCSWRGAVEFVVFFVVTIAYLCEFTVSRGVNIRYLTGV